MSYNNYNYSPYFQHGVGQDGRPQQSYPDLTGGSYQQGQPYTYTTTNQKEGTSQPPYFTQAPADQTSNAYESQRYGTIHAASNERQQDTRQEHGHSYNGQPRASVDTTALGSLAYASSLGQDSREPASTARDSPSMQHMMNYNRLQNRSTSNRSPLSGTIRVTNENEHSRSSSGGAMSAKDVRGLQAASTPPYLTYPALKDDRNGSRTSVTSQSAQEIQNTGPSILRPGGQQQPNTQNPQPARPFSARHTSTSGSHLNSHPSQSSATSIQGHTVHSPASHMISHKVSNGLDQARTQPLPQPRNPSMWSSAPASASQATSEPPNSRSSTTIPDTRMYNRQAAPDRVNEYHHSIPTPPQIHLQPSNTQQSDLRKSNNSKLLQEQEQKPTTVDPNQIFNHYEHQRRQAAAAAAAAAAAIEEAKKTAHGEGAQKQTSNAGMVAEADVDSRKKDQMELEMKQMIEKMRDYKAKDPSLFSQIWEQVKKGQPPNRASSQAPNPSKEASQPLGPSASNISHAVSANGQLPSPSPTHTQLPLESELAIDRSSSSRPPELDRGKFPAQRRKRGGAKGSSRESAGYKKSKTPPVETASSAYPAKPPQMTDNSAPTTAHNPHDFSSGNTQYSQAAFRGNMDPTMRPIPAYQPRTSSLDPNLPSTAQQSHPSNLDPNLPQTAPQVRPEPVDEHGSGSPSTDPPKSTASGGIVQQALNGYVQAPKPALGTIWPENNKQALANAASIALTTAPANAGKHITSNEIHQLLDRNPSYTELCKILEARGFVIERGDFARLLLASVPETKIQTAGEKMPQANITEQQPPVVKGPSRTSQAQSTKDRAPVAPMFGMLVPGPQNSISSAKSSGSHNDRPADNRFAPRHLTNRLNAPHHHSTVYHPEAQAAGHAPTIYVSPFAPALPPAPVPLTKQEMARKRTFEEIIDLTQSLSDEEDAQPKPPKRARVDNSGSDAPVDISTSHENAKESVDQELPEEEITGKNLDSNDRIVDLSKFKFTSSKREHLRSEDVIRPMNKRHDALRRSTYNSKTIARDILVAAGKHPTMTPLNFHLESLRKNFRNVDYSSNLSTFRWDLVDPGGEPASSASKPTNRINNSVDMDVDSNDADDEVTYLTTQPRHRTQIASTVGRDDGEFVASDVIVTRPMKGMPSRRGRLRGRGQRRTLSQRNDSITQSRPMTDHTPSSLQSTSNPINENVTSQRVEGSSRQGAGARSGAGAESGAGAGAGAGPTRVALGTAADALPPPQNGMLSTRSKPRGRPPGSQNRTPSNQKQPSSAPAKVPTKPERLSNIPISMPSRPRPSNTSSTPGRPSGLRQNMSMIPSDGIAVVIELRSPSIIDHNSVKSKRGNKRKSVPVEPARRKKTQQPSSPTHKIYKCRWKGCPSKLHNLETLRDHVRMHRENMGKGPFPCLWTDCGRSQVSIHEKSEDNRRGKGKEKEERQPLQFGSEAAWDRHMDGRHLDRFAWELGDGPSTHGSDAEVSDYLSDSQGRQTTPIAGTSGRPDPLFLASAPKNVRQYHRAQGNQTELEKAQTFLASMEARKRALGPGIEPGGTRLVTDELRSHLVYDMMMGKVPENGL